MFPARKKPRSVTETILSCTLDWLPWTVTCFSRKKFKGQSLLCSRLETVSDSPVMLHTLQVQFIPQVIAMYERHWMHRVSSMKKSNLVTTRCKTSAKSPAARPFTSFYNLVTSVSSQKDRVNDLQRLVVSLPLRSGLIGRQTDITHACNGGSVSWKRRFPNGHRIQSQAWPGLQAQFFWMDLFFWIIYWTDLVVLWLSHCRTHNRERNSGGGLHSQATLVHVVWPVGLVSWKDDQSGQRRMLLLHVPQVQRFTIHKSGILWLAGQKSS